MGKKTLIRTVVLNTFSDISALFHTRDSVVILLPHTCLFYLFTLSGCLFVRLFTILLFLSLHLLVFSCLLPPSLFLSLCLCLSLPFSLSLSLSLSLSVFCSRPNPNKGGRPAISACCWADYTQVQLGAMMATYFTVIDSPSSLTPSLSPSLPPSLSPSSAISRPLP